MADNLIEHPLTQSQIAFVERVNAENAELVRIGKELERRLRSFLQYVLEENQLPETKDGYKLSEDGKKLVGERKE